jgi:penicillin-binding protein 2
MIVDRNNKPLAINNLGFTISIAPHLQIHDKTKDTLEKLFVMIAKRFDNIDIEEVKQRYQKNDSAYNHKYIQVVDYIPYEEFFRHYTVFNSNDNFKISPANKRNYPYGQVASHIIGYTGKISDKDIKNDRRNRHYKSIGKNGLEKFYDKQLKGNVGVKNVVVNAMNKEVQILSYSKPKSKNIKISIDIELQKYISSLFDKQNTASNEPALSGAVVVMNIKNGQILAAASFPEYNPNIFVNGISYEEWGNMMNNPDKPFTNKITHGLYPPGSVIKMAHSIGFLNNPQTASHKVKCSGSIVVGNRRFRCWKHSGHKKVDTRKAIRESCDVFYYEGSLVSGINNMAKNLAMFGFGQKTGIDMPREFVGINPNKLWKKKRYSQPWYLGETVNASIGQGYVLATPLQIARYTGALAYGKLVTPSLNIEKKAQIVDINATKEQLALIRQGMIDVVQHEKGTANKGITTDIKIAGKTGTAQVASISQKIITRIREQDLQYYKRSHAWLTTYAPYDNPLYVVTVLLEHGGHGGGACGPYVTKIYDTLQDMAYIK